MSARALGVRPDAGGGRTGPHQRLGPVAIALLLVVAALLAAPAAAQPNTSAIRGVVVNRQTQAPVEGALARLTWTDRSATADSSGRFELTGLRPGVGLLQVRALGYRVGSWAVKLAADQAMSDTFELEPVAIQLSEVVVPGQPVDDWRSPAGFEARRRRGGGYFITEEQIRQQRPLTLVEILRTVPGVATACSYSGCQVRMSRSPRPCSPEYFLDGYPATFATGPSFPIQGIRGIEIYPDAFSAPIELQKIELRCGVIAIWTRMGP
ncbi:MAG TPA: TonB-dependent receptor [Streptosporangiaceae bacterium]|nr:TonB-dependent receptor [Streptosporangiaceae bacterium]